jgi:hypothetical protein
MISGVPLLVFGSCVVVIWGYLFGMAEQER